jgi:hypothetical protein
VFLQGSHDFFPKARYVLQKSFHPNPMPKASTRGRPLSLLNKLHGN